MNQKNFKKLLLITLFCMSCSSSIQPYREVAATNDSLNYLKNLKCSSMLNVGCSGKFNAHLNDNTEIGLLTNGEASLKARLKSLKSAKKSIRIQSLVIKADESGKRIAQILMEKKKAGVDVKVIVDAFSNLDLETQLMYYDMKMANIEVEGYEAAYLVWVNEVSHKDPEQPNKRFHDKMWIIDGEDQRNSVAIIGGMNIANEYFRLGLTSDKIWRDQDFLIRGNMVNDIVKAFDRNFKDQKDIKAAHLINTDITWKYWRKMISDKFSLQDPRKKNLVIQNKLKTIEQQSENFEVQMRPAKALFIQNRPRYNETYIEEAYQKVFLNARSEIIVINAYFIPSKPMIDALKTAARNGVSVKLITNSAETNDLPQMAYASRYLYLDLLSVNEERGVKGKLEIFEWVGNKFGEGTIHAKFAVIDEQTVVGGSYNLDPRSEKLNSETVVIFEQPELALELSQFIKKNDMPKVKKITMSEAREYYSPSNPPDIFQLLLWNGLKGQL